LRWRGKIRQAWGDLGGVRITLAAHLFLHSLRLLLATTGGFAFAEGFGRFGTTKEAE
jgi:uncharacterized membrane protein YccC